MKFNKETTTPKQQEQQQEQLREHQQQSPATNGIKQPPFSVVLLLPSSSPVKMCCPRIAPTSCSASSYWRLVRCSWTLVPTPLATSTSRQGAAPWVPGLGPEALVYIRTYLIDCLLHWTPCCCATRNGETHQPDAVEVLAMRTPFAPRGGIALGCRARGPWLGATFFR